MQLSSLDWSIIALYFALLLAAGLFYARRAGQGIEEFFVSGRNLPWWLLGTSMVATTFSTDTPNLVTDIVRSDGVSGNWTWWVFVITGMCTVFVYARLWRRSKVLTDLGFYELRYSGSPAAFLRGFRAAYLGIFFNVMIMATVTLAAIKIAGVLLGLDRITTVVVCAAVTAVYSALGGLWGVVVTDLLLFVLAMVGSVAAAVYAINQPQVGGLSALVNNPDIADRVSFLPDFSNWETALTVIIIPVAVQWWSTWYPGAEPGGGGYVAQRMLAARDEKHALLATLWFNVAHYGIRPWPWILVALASMLVYPDLAAIQQAFPGIDPAILGNDLAYPAMLVFLPHGLLGLTVASLAAAYMSTISTHLNWGASYVVDDVYRRFLKPEASPAHYVAIARLTTVVLVVLASLVSLWLENALQAFRILLQIGAGTGLIFLLRWFWWRINAWSELSAMVISFLVAVFFEGVYPHLGGPALHSSVTLVIGVVITTAGWLVVTFLTSPVEREVLQKFYDAIGPFPRGWEAAVDTLRGESAETLSLEILCWFLGVVSVLCFLFGTGYLIFGQGLPGAALLTISGFSSFGIFRLLPQLDL